MFNIHQNILNNIYQDAHIYSSQHQAKNITDTYGEILYPSVDKILASITLTPNDVFVDLGSGQGKLALQVFFNSLANTVNGIELAKALHQQALLAKQKAQLALPEKFATKRQLNFTQGDFFQTSFTDATVILLGSPCFSPNFMLALGKIINDLPDIHTVLTLRPILNLTHLHFQKAIRVECSWDTALCYLYRKT